MRKVLIYFLLLAVLVACSPGTQESRDVELFESIEEGFTDLPVTPHMPNHMFKGMGDDAYLFLHFDGPIHEAATIWFTGVAYPGRFCQEDQDRMNEKYGEGFTHFHKKLVDSPDATPQDGHGGAGGETGYWFKHVVVTEHNQPWGHLTPGVDINFMPTPPPLCEELGMEGY